MNYKRIEALPQGIPLHPFQPSHNMWTAFYSAELDRYYVFRPHTPAFAIEVEDPAHIEAVAGDIIHRFLKKINDIGIRSL